MFYLDHRLSIIIGAYGSGKSEIAVNMALSQREALPDKKLLIADLDIVNPFYRSSDCASVLEEAFNPLGHLHAFLACMVITNENLECLSQA